MAEPSFGAMHPSFMASGMGVDVVSVESAPLGANLSGPLKPPPEFVSYAMGSGPKSPQASKNVSESEATKPVAPLRSEVCYHAFFPFGATVFSHSACVGQPYAQLWDQDIPASSPFSCKRLSEEISSSEMRSSTRCRYKAKVGIGIDQ